MTYPAQKVAGEQVTADDFNDYTLNPAYTYGETLAPGEAVYLKNSDGKIWKASAATQAHVDAFVGIVIVAGVADDTNQILAPGKIAQGLSSLTAGSNVYLSDTAGALSVSPGTIPLVVGLAISTTSMLINKSTERVATNLFGDASDGDVTISSTVTLTRDMFYNTLTLANSGILETGGYRIYAKTIYRPAASNGYIRNNGGAGGNGTAGVGAVAGSAGAAGAAAPGITVPASVAGAAGIAGQAGTGTSTAGQNGTAGAAQSPAYSSTNGSGGGNGGATITPAVVAGGTGGAGGASTQTKEVPRSYDLAARLYEVSAGATITFPKPAGGAGSGATGGYSASTSQNRSSGGSGGGGGGGGVVWVAAQTIKDESSGDMFVAQGGAGGAGNRGDASGAGNGVVGGSGGGAGGNGGIVIRIYRYLIGTATVNVSGGAGGAGGAAWTWGTGTGNAGATGATGGTGLSIGIQV